MELGEEIRIRELQETFEGQNLNGLLGELALNLVCEWIKEIGKIKIIIIQAFGMIENRPDEWNVSNYQQYLQEIVNDLKIQYSKNKLPILVIITGPNGLSDPIGIAGREAVETSLELEKMLQTTFAIENSLKDKYLVIPCGQIMQNDKLDYVRNLVTAKQIMAQINQKMNLTLSIDEFWTDSVRFWKHIACLICLGMNFEKVKTAERVEIDQDGKPSENQDSWRQTCSIGIILGLLLQQFLKTNLKLN